MPRFVSVAYVLYGGSLPMILSVTGHRPHHLQGGYSEPTRLRLVELAVSQISQLQPDRVRTGMAQGWDQACAEAARRLGVPYVAVLPNLAGLSQDALWPRPARDRYERLLADAADAEIGPYAGKGREFQLRDRQVVDGSDWLLALWDGSRSGTSYTVDYARAPARGVVVWNCWREWVAL